MNDGRLFLSVSFFFFIETSQRYRDLSILQTMSTVHKSITIMSYISKRFFFNTPFDSALLSLIIYIVQISDISVYKKNKCIPLIFSKFYFVYKVKKEEKERKEDKVKCN